jgi:hypothetical protein
MQARATSVGCQQLAVGLALLGWLALWMPCSVFAEDAYFSVRDARSQLKEGVYLLDANLVYRFSDSALEALHNGIPLVLETQIKVGRRRAWLWTDTVAALSQRYRLHYHALSDRYVIHNLNTDQRRSFATLDDALHELGSVRGFPMLDEKLLRPGAEYSVAVRAVLVIEELPTPMRLWAHVSDQWRHDSSWYTWRLQP